MSFFSSLLQNNFSAVAIPPINHLPTASRTPSPQTPETEASGSTLTLHQLQELPADQLQISLFRHRIIPASGKVNIDSSLEIPNPNLQECQTIHSKLQQPWNASFGGKGTTCQPLELLQQLKRFGLTAAYLDVEGMYVWLGTDYLERAVAPILQEKNLLIDKELIFETLLSLETPKITFEVYMNLESIAAMLKQKYGIDSQKVGDRLRFWLYDKQERLQIEVQSSTTLEHPALIFWNRELAACQAKAGDHFQEIDPAKGFIINDSTNVGMSNLLLLLCRQTPAPLCSIAALSKPKSVMQQCRRFAHGERMLFNQDWKAMKPALSQANEEAKKLGNGDTVKGWLSLLDEVAYENPWERFCTAYQLALWIQPNLTADQMQLFWQQLAVPKCVGRREDLLGWIWQGLYKHKIPFQLLNNWLAIQGYLAKHSVQAEKLARPSSTAPAIHLSKNHGSLTVHLTTSNLQKRLYLQIPLDTIEKLIHIAKHMEKEGAHSYAAHLSTLYNILYRSEDLPLFLQEPASGLPCSQWNHLATFHPPFSRQMALQFFQSPYPAIGLLGLQLWSISRRLDSDSQRQIDLTQYLPAFLSLVAYSDSRQMQLTVQALMQELKASIHPDSLIIYDTIQSWLQQPSLQNTSLVERVISSLHAKNPIRALEAFNLLHDKLPDPSLKRLAQKYGFDWLKATSGEHSLQPHVKFLSYFFQHISAVNLGKIGIELISALSCEPSNKEKLRWGSYLNALIHTIFSNLDSEQIRTLLNLSEKTSNGKKTDWSSIFSRLAAWDQPLLVLKLTTYCPASKSLTEAFRPLLPLLVTFYSQNNEKEFEEFLINADLKSLPDSHPVAEFTHFLLKERCKELEAPKQPWPTFFKLWNSLKEHLSQKIVESISAKIQQIENKKTEERNRAYEERATYEQAALALEEERQGEACIEIRFKQLKKVYKNGNWQEVRRFLDNLLERLSVKEESPKGSFIRSALHASPFTAEELASLCEIGFAWMAHELRERKQPELDAIIQHPVWKQLIYLDPAKSLNQLVAMRLSRSSFSVQSTYSPLEALLDESIIRLANSFNPADWVIFDSSELEKFLHLLSMNSQLSPLPEGHCLYEPFLRLFKNLPLLLQKKREKLTLAFLQLFPGKALAKSSPGTWCRLAIMRDNAIDSLSPHNRHVHQKRLIEEMELLLKEHLNLPWTQQKRLRQLCMCYFPLYPQQMTSLFIQIHQKFPDATWNRTHAFAYCMQHAMIEQPPVALSLWSSSLWQEEASDAMKRYFLNQIVLALFKNNCKETLLNFIENPPKSIDPKLYKKVCHAFLRKFYLPKTPLKASKKQLLEHYETALSFASKYGRMTVSVWPELIKACSEAQLPELADKTIRFCQQNQKFTSLKPQVLSEIQEQLFVLLTKNFNRGIYYLEHPELLAHLLAIPLEDSFPFFLKLFKAISNSSERQETNRNKALLLKLIKIRYAIQDQLKGKWSKKLFMDLDGFLVGLLLSPNCSIPVDRQIEPLLTLLNSSDLRSFHEQLHIHLITILNTLIERNKKLSAEQRALLSSSMTIRQVRSLDMCCNYLYVLGRHHCVDPLPQLWDNLIGSLQDPVISGNHSKLISLLPKAVEESVRLQNAELSKRIDSLYKIAAIATWVNEHPEHCIAYFLASYQKIQFLNEIYLENRSIEIRDELFSQMKHLERCFFSSAALPAMPQNAAFSVIKICCDRVVESNTLDSYQQLMSLLTLALNLNAPACIQSSQALSEEIHYSTEREQIFNDLFYLFVSYADKTKDETTSYFLLERARFLLTIILSHSCNAKEGGSYSSRCRDRLLALLNQFKQFEEIKPIKLLLLEDSIHFWIEKQFPEKADDEDLDKLLNAYTPLKKRCANPNEMLTDSNTTLIEAINHNGLNQASAHLLGISALLKATERRSEKKQNAFKAINMLSHQFDWMFHAEPQECLKVYGEICHYFKGIPLSQLEDYKIFKQLSLSIDLEESGETWSLVFDAEKDKVPNKHLTAYLEILKKTALLLRDLHDTLEKPILNTDDTKLERISPLVKQFYKDFLSSFNHKFFLKHRDAALDLFSIILPVICTQDLILFEISPSLNQPPSMSFVNHLLNKNEVAVKATSKDVDVINQWLNHISKLYHDLLHYNKKKWTKSKPELMTTLGNLVIAMDLCSQSSNSKK